MILIMKELIFLFQKKDYGKIERQNNIYINVFCYENGLTYPVYGSNQKFRDCMDLMLISDENKSHYVYIKDFCAINQKIRIKNIFFQMLFTVF